MRRKVVLVVNFLLFSEYLTNITAIETEGVLDGTANLWVDSYYMSTSNGTEETSFVEYTEKGERKIVSTGFIVRNLTNRLHSAVAFSFKDAWIMFTS